MGRENGGQGGKFFFAWKKCLHMKKMEMMRAKVYHRTSMLTSVE